jgi:toxin ParE1/3/4
MMLSILIRPAAERDIETAFRWYEEKRAGLGRDFLLCVEEGLAKIQLGPEVYPVVHKNVRRILIRRFPYGILYLRDQWNSGNSGDTSEFRGHLTQFSRSVANTYGVPRISGNTVSMKIWTPLQPHRVAVLRPL